MDEGALQAEIQHCTESKDANGTGYMRYGTYPVRSHRCRGCNIAYDSIITMNGEKSAEGIVLPGDGTEGRPETESG